MHAIALLVALTFAGQLAPDDIPADVEPPPVPLVEQTVECISVAHLPDNVTMVYFWDSVQGEFTLLDHRWLPTDAALFRQGDEWCVAWVDCEWSSERCYRVIKTKCYVESWETESPMRANNQKQWFLQVGGPGLKAPPVIRR